MQYSINRQTITAGVRIGKLDRWKKARRKCGSTRVPRVVLGVAPETVGGCGPSLLGAINSGRTSADPIRWDAELNPPEAGATHSFRRNLPILACRAEASAKARSKASCFSQRRKFTGRRWYTKLPRCGLDL